MRQWWSLGRFMPIGLIDLYGPHYILHDRVTYKLILVGLTILATLCVARLMVVLSMPTELALLAAALSAVTYQLHNFHDPLLAYSGITQLVTILFALSAIAFARWLRGGRSLDLLVSLALMIVANLTYEAAYPLVVMHIAVVLVEHKRFRSLAKPLLLTAAFLLPPLIARSGATGAYGIDAQPLRVIPTLARQLSAPLPMANYLDPYGPRALPTNGLWNPGLRGALIALLMLPVIVAAAGTARGWRPRRRVVAGLALVAGGMLVLPAGLVSLAERYQEQIRWGVGYLPVFFGYVAVGILGALAFWCVSRLVPSVPLVVAAALFVGVIGGANALGSSKVVQLSRPVAVARDQIDEALRAGLLNDTASETMLLFDRRQIGSPNGPWLPGYFWGIDNWFFTITGRRMRALSLEPGSPLGRQCQDNTGAPSTCATPSDPIVWFTTGLSPDGRWILMTPLPGSLVGPTTDLFLAPGTERARLAIRSRSTATLSSLSVSWRDAAGRTLISPPASVHLLRRSGGWSMLEVDVPPAAIAASGSVLST